jgi:head-tail adaptor
MGLGSVTQKRTPTLQAGRLRHRVAIVQINPAQDTTGGFDINADVIYATVWASIEALAGTETPAAGSRVSTSTHQIIIRYIGAAPSWVANHVYAGKALVKDKNGYLQQAQANGGTSGATAPDWATVQGDFTQDGNPSTGMQWKNLGPAPVRTGVNANMQVWYQGRQFQIDSVLNPDERTKLLVLICTEVNDSLQQITNQPGGLE